MKKTKKTGKTVAEVVNSILRDACETALTCDDDDVDYDTPLNEEEIFQEWREMDEAEQMEILTSCIGHVEHDCTSCCIGEQVLAETWGLA